MAHGLAEFPRTWTFGRLRITSSRLDLAQMIMATSKRVKGGERVKGDIERCRVIFF